MDKQVTKPLRDMHPFLRKELAKRCGISFNYLTKLVHDESAKPSPKLAMKLERYTDGALLREKMRPDIWQ